MRQGLVPENARGHAGGDARDRGRPAERDAVGHRRPRREDRAGLAAGGPLGGAGGGPASPRDAVAADVGGREQDGRGVGQLSPEVGAVVRRAIEAACDQVRGADARAAAADGRAGPGAEAEPPSLAQRQADALGVIAECALSGGLDRGTAGDRYQVVVHVDAEALTEAPDVPGGNVGDGNARARATRRRPGSVRGGRSTSGPRHAVAPVPDPFPGDATGRVHPGRPPPEDGAQRGGRHPHLVGDGATAGLRRVDPRDAARPRRQDPRRRPPDADDLAGLAPGVERPRPPVPVSGVPERPGRCSPRQALDPRRDDGARQSRPPVPAATNMA